MPVRTERISLVLWKRRITRTKEAFSGPTFDTSSSQSLWSLDNTHNQSKRCQPCSSITKVKQYNTLTVFDSFLTILWFIFQMWISATKRVTCYVYGIDYPVITSKVKGETWGPHESARRVSDLSPLVSATSKGDRLRQLMSSLFLNMAHIMGVIQAKVVKDRKPALSRGWDLDIETSPNINSTVGQIHNIQSQ